MRVFRVELLSMAKLIALCLTFAFAAEFLLRDLLPPHLLVTYVGEESTYAIPLAVLVGAPMYLDGYAALPLVRGLLDLGMSPGAAMAFLVSGGAVSIWGVMAVVAVLRPPTIALFVTLAVIGSLSIGYAFRLDLGVAAMKSGRIGNTLAVFWRTLCARRRSQRDRPLSRLDDHLLNDLGITRNQADEIERRHEHQTKSSDKIRLDHQRRDCVVLSCRKNPDYRSALRSICVTLMAVGCSLRKSPPLGPSLNAQNGRCWIGSCRRSA